VNDAVEISMVMEKPVKMVWTREEDMQHDYYRPTSLHVMKGAIDNENHLTAWTHRVVAPSILFSQLVKMPFPFKEKLDIISVEGAKNIRYDIPNILVDYRMANTPVPVGWWRSVYDSQNAFANECFMDELAEAAGKDPLQFRLELLPKSSRERNVLTLLAEKAGWETFNSGPYYQGLSFHKSFGTYVAQVARVTVKDNTIKVGEIHCAVDCGTVINPSIVDAQISGAIIYGLSAALKSKITVSNGRIDQSNFDDFDVLRMDETPKIHVHLIESDAAPSGVGEPGLPPAAPAVANAVYAATGKRIRRLPITIQDII
jgi:isoquinoline 1-oxidoreductase beta subunit